MKFIIVFFMITLLLLPRYQSIDTNTKESKDKSKTKKKGSKDWSKLKLDDLEKEWEAGD